MMMLPAETIKKYYRVQRRDISFFRFVLEGCDGLAVLTTLDAPGGKVVLSIAPGCEQDVADVISGLRSEMPIEPDPAPEMINSMANNETGRNNQAK